MSDDEIVYEDETNYIDWLTVERLANFMVVLDPTLAQINQDPEQESWDNAVGKYAVDEIFVDSNDTKLSVDIRHCEEVSGHD